MKPYLGDEFPAAFILDGVWMPLVSERRWTRIYAAKDQKMWAEISRLMDGSSSITFPEFAREWPSWSKRDRGDFCGACSWLHNQTDFPEIIRFIMNHGDLDDWSAVATSIGKSLPSGEAFDFLNQLLCSIDPGRASSNIIQGMSLINHPETEDVLRAHLSSLWSHPLLWQDDEFINWPAFDATTCIAHLLELGAMPEDFAAQVTELSKHVCSNNRESCRHSLQKHYSWLE